jgi:hypothetical protein
METASPIEIASETGLRVVVYKISEKVTALSALLSTGERESNSEKGRASAIDFVKLLVKLSVRGVESLAGRENPREITSESSACSGLV